MKLKIRKVFVYRSQLRKGSGEFLFAYKPPNNNNLKLFFEETTQSLNQLLSKFDNIIIAGDFNIDAGSKNCNKFKQFADLCHSFDLINVKTCFKSATSQSSLDVTLTNRPRSFPKTAAITTRLSDYHKMVITTFRSSYTRKPPQNII